MFHTKFQGHQPSGSGEEDFKGVLPYMGMSAILVIEPKQFLKFWLTYQKESSYEIEFNWPHSFYVNYVLIYWWDSNMSDLG